MDTKKPEFRDITWKDFFPKAIRSAMGLEQIPILKLVLPETFRILQYGNERKDLGVLEEPKESSVFEEPKDQGIPEVDELAIDARNHGCSWSMISRFWNGTGNVQCEKVRDNLIYHAKHR